MIHAGSAKCCGPTWAVRERTSAANAGAQLEDTLVRHNSALLHEHRVDAVRDAPQTRADANVECGLADPQLANLGVGHPDNSLLLHGCAAQRREERGDGGHEGLVVCGGEHACQLWWQVETGRLVRNGGICLYGFTQRVQRLQAPAQHASRRNVLNDDEADKEGADAWTSSSCSAAAAARTGATLHLEYLDAPEMIL